MPGPFAAIAFSHEGPITLDHRFHCWHVIACFSCDGLDSFRSLIALEYESYNGSSWVLYELMHDTTVCSCACAGMQPTGLAIAHHYNSAFGREIRDALRHVFNLPYAQISANDFDGTLLSKENPVHTE